MTQLRSIQRPALVGARWTPWIQAARPIAFPMILVPLLMGQAFAVFEGAAFRWISVLHALMFGALYQAHLLYANDHADEAVDRANHQYWLSGGSRVLPEGKLQADQLLAGARVLLVVLLVFTLYVAIADARPLMLIGLLLAVTLSWAYNRPPLRLSYRGHGEVLQGLGCGVVLPLMGFCLQRGQLDTFPWLLLVPLYLVFHAGNLVTALPDLASDEQGGKRTFPVRHGDYSARWTAVLLLLVAYASMIVLSPLPSVTSAWVVLPAAAILFSLPFWRLLHRQGMHDFRRCKRFVTLVSASQAWFLVVWVVALFVSASR